MSLGYIEVGICSRCSKPDHLFVSSGLEYDQPARCLGCLVSWFNQFEYDYETLSALFPIISEGNLCAGCERPEFETETQSWILIDAELADHTVVRIHQECQQHQYSRCETCKTTYASTRYRQWGRNHAIPSHRFVVVRNVEGENKCNTCTEAHIEANGGDDNFYECDCCDWTVRISDTGWWDGTRYCQNCIDNNVYECDDCGEQYWEGGHDYCSYEEEDDDNGVIHSYSYRPSPAFFGKGQYYLGFELEVEARNNSRYEGAEIAQNALGSHAYMKDDGSLSDGFEIVTHPHTLEMYHKEFNWDFLDKLKRDGYRSWNTDSCGLHVHVSRTAFGLGINPWDTVTRRQATEVILKRQSHELRFMKLVYDNQRQVERIAGRAGNQYATFRDKGKLVPKVKFGNQSSGRYSAINTENDATLEVRVFKGSLRKERVLSAIEFVTASVEYTRDLKVTSTNNALSWLRFTAYVSENSSTYPNLAIIMSESFANDINPNDN